MGEKLLEQNGIVPFSNVWMTPVIALSVSMPRTPPFRVRKAGYLLDPVDEGDLPSE
jgi:hypothetical protein